MCAIEDSANSEDGRVYKCLVRKAADITPGCAKELGRAVHMAFYVWQPGEGLESVRQACSLLEISRQGSRLLLGKEDMCVKGKCA